MTEPLDAGQFPLLLRGRLGQPLELHLELDSTNRLMLQRGGEGAPEGATIIADAQTAGRGRQSRAWFSPPGTNLYISVLLRPRFEPSRVAMLSLVTAVAARETFLEFGLPVGIKWPNDLLAGEPPAKIAGILAELRATPGRVEFVVVGVGFNLNLAGEAFPAELSGIATSYRALTGVVVERARFAAAFLWHLEHWYDRYSEGGAEPVLERWRAGNVTLGREVRFESATGTKQGMARRIDAEGALWVETEAGLERVTAGDVHLVRMEALDGRHRPGRENSGPARP